MNLLLRNIQLFSRVARNKTKVIADPKARVQNQIKEIVKKKGISTEIEEIKNTLKQYERKDMQNSNDRMEKEVNQSIRLMKMDQKLQRQKKIIDKHNALPIEEQLQKLDVPKEILRPHQKIKKIRQNLNKKNLLQIKPSAEGEKQSKANDFIKLKDMYDLKQSQKDQVKAEQIEQNQKQDTKLQILKARQDLMLAYIQEKTKMKPIPIKLEPKPKNKDKNGQQNNEELSEEQINLMIRREKLIQAVQNKVNPKDVSFKVSKQQRIARMYSPEIIEKAKLYQSSELQYFKTLVFNHQKQTKILQPNRRHQTNPLNAKQQLQLKKSQQKYIAPAKDNLYAIHKQEEGLVAHENIDYYKEKALTQFKESKSIKEEDKILKKEGDRDLEKAYQAHDIFLDDVVFPVDSKMEKREIYQSSSFGKEDKRVKSLTQRLNSLGFQYQIEDIKAISKDILFTEKALLEKQQEFQIFQQKREKKKKMKEQLKQIHKNQLRDDLDFDKTTEKVMTLKQLRSEGNLEDLEENIKKRKEFKSQQMAVLKDEDRDAYQSRIHHIKTFRNIEIFLNKYFAQGLCNIRADQLNYIQIAQYIPNRTNSVINIFWAVEDKYIERLGILKGTPDYQEQFDKVKKQVTKKLDKQSNYISGKITQFLGLRYGPQIRFIYDLKTSETEETIAELNKYKKQITMMEIEEMKAQGKINTPKEEKQYYRKMMRVAEDNLYEYSNRKELISKTYRMKNNKKAWVEKKQQNKRQKQMKKQSILSLSSQKKQNVEEKHQRKAPKKSSVDKLWSKIDLL